MKQIKDNKGQVMILSVLLISSAVLAAASLAGLLILFQLRQATDAESSAKAVFAADSGIERALFARYQENHCESGEGVDIVSPQNFFSFENVDVEFRVVFSEGDGCNSAKSTALTGRSSRSFEILFGNLESVGGQFIE